MAQQQQQQQRGPGAGLGGAGAALGGAGAPSGLPETAQLREAVAQNPALLAQVIQTIVQNNPELAAQINANPEILYQLLAGMGGGEDGEDGDDMPGAAGGPQTISLTAEEMEAIGRVSLSYSTYWASVLMVRYSYRH